jgi:hypothetical protein
MTFKGFNASALAALGFDASEGGGLPVDGNPSPTPVAHWVPDTARRQLRSGNEWCS